MKDYSDHSDQTQIAVQLIAPMRQNIPIIKNQKSVEAMFRGDQLDRPPLKIFQDFSKFFKTIKRGMSWHRGELGQGQEEKRAVRIA